MRRSQKRVGDGGILVGGGFGKSNILRAILARGQKFVHTRHTDDNVGVFKPLFVGFERGFVRENLVFGETFAFENIDGFGEYAFALVEHGGRVHFHSAFQILVVFNHSSEHKLAIRASAHV